MPLSTCFFVIFVSVAPGFSVFRPRQTNRQSSTLEADDVGIKLVKDVFIALEGVPSGQGGEMGWGQGM